MELTITLLGEFAVTVGGVLVDPASWRRRHAAAVVKILALAPGRRLHRERLMDTLWPDLTVDEAAPRLHKAAHYARRALGHPDSVVLADDMVALFPGREAAVDVLEFEDLAAQALSDKDPVAAATAAGRYSGDVLPQDLYETWTQDVRDRLRLMYLDVLRLAGRWQTLVGVEPTDEEAHLRLITALARRGDRGGALRQYERLERALRQHLGVAPSRAAVELRERLLTVGSAPVVPLRAPSDATPGTGGQGEGPVTRSAGDAGVAGSPLVGRDADQDRIGHVLDAVAAGAGRTLLISGPAGVGKTSLLAWLERSASSRGMRVGSGTAAQVEGAWPYAPVLEALADLCRRHPTLLDGLDDALRVEIEAGLTGRSIEGTARGGHQRLFVAAAELLRLAAAGSGAVLVVDDAHLADDASLRLLHYLARSTASEQVLLVLTQRPGGSPALAEIRTSLTARAMAASLVVEPLNRQAVSRLVRQIQPAADDHLVDSIWSASAGVPYFVVELARSGPARAGEPGQQQLLSSVAPDAVRALASAAVLGQTFDTDEFVAVSGLPDAQAYAVLDDAEESLLLRRTEAGHEFRHALIRDAVLDGLPGSDLRALHRQAAKALIRLDASPARIGHHLVEAGDRAGAVPWMLRTAVTSASLGAYHEALNMLAAIESRAQGAERAALLALRADLLMARADVGAVDAYREALAAAPDLAARSRLRVRLARAATAAGDLDTAAVALEDLDPDGSADDVDLLLARGSLALFQRDLRAADAAASEARRRIALDAPGDWQRFDVVALEGLVAHTRGEWFQRLRAELRRGLDRPALASRIFDSHLCVAEYLLYGPTPYEEVLELAASLRDTAQRSGVLRAVAFATALRGETALLMGNLELADVELSEAVDLHRDIGSAAGEAHSLQRLAEVRLEQGDRADANRLLTRALPIARFSSLAHHVIQRIYGTMITAAPDHVASMAAVERAEATLGPDDLCAFCSIMLAVPAARACADAGLVADARRHLEAAERSAQLWEGTSWEASLLEVRAHLASAEGDLGAAQRLRTAAINLFEGAGQPLDAQRCRNWQPRTAAPVAAV